MPKQIWKIDQFHGGLNTNSDPRDIADNELSDAEDVMVDELGKIRMMGGGTTHDSTNLSPRANQISPGYGLFQFSHDREGGEDAGTSEGETGVDYLVFSESDNAGTVDIYSNKDNAWGSPITGMTDISGGLRKDVFYSSDGALRVCDSNFVNSNTNKWYGYIKRTHFDGLAPGGAADDYDGWFSKDQAIAVPTRGLYFGDLNTAIVGLTGDAASDINTFVATLATAFEGMDTELDRGDYIIVNMSDDKARIITSRTNATTIETETLGSGDYNGDVVVIAPSAGTGFNIQAGGSGSTGSGWTAGDYSFGTTFIYDNNQESLVFENAGTDNVTLTTTNNLIIGVIATSPYDPRITGGRVYTRLHQTTDPWQFVAEISLKYGVKTSISGSWDAWSLTGAEVTEGYAAALDLTATGSGDAGTNVYLMQTSLTYGLSISLLSSPNVETYESLNGYPQNLATLDARYRTAIVANRKTYIGNVKTTNEDGEEVVLGDAMLKSPVNKFDTFPLSRIIEASIRDGDEIVKLEEYADRILQFKKNKMHLINVSQEIEFLEDTFVHKGVSHPAATCKTDFGIAWVNTQGCYLYDGEKVTNLLEKKGRQIIKESDWFNHVTGSNAAGPKNPMIGYVSKKRQLIVVDDYTTIGTGRIFLYDMVTQSWVTSYHDTFLSGPLTNFVTDWNGDLVHINDSDTGFVSKWDDAADSSTQVDIKTKDIDFGQPAQVKRIYKFYVTHRGDTSNIQLSYSKDGNSPPYTEAGDELPATSPTTAWVTTEITPTTFSCYSVRLRLFSDGTTPSDFEINDISIVFRVKGMR